jgi:hypothetical protein
MIIALVFEKNANFSENCRKSQKIEIITSTLDSLEFSKLSLTVLNVFVFVSGVATEEAGDVTKMPSPYYKIMLS